MISSIFSNHKDFDGAVGNATANRCGLHLFRIVWSDAVQWLRCAPFFLLAPKAAWIFHKQGYLVIENFLDNQQYRSATQEVAYQLRDLPPPLGNVKRQSFGDKLPHAKGYDRYDGDTLNRFARLSLQRSVVKRAFQSLRMHRLTLALFGMINNPMRYFIYELRHGDEAELPDSQKDTHRDTFHHTYKLWYFTEDVTLDTGPLEYSPGSHTSSLARLRWEYERSVKVSSGKTQTKGGAFRASPDELKAMGYKEPQPLCVKANSLIIANTRGFHRRGSAAPSTTRNGVYGYFRPTAFLPFLEP